ncbi:MAG TPA: S-layer homology domain-containing protein [Clostridiales bacterium]|nr:S-layer homology domain-containing protein [Clostridiales bacterium]
MKKMNKNIVFALVVMALVLCFSMGAAAATAVDAEVTLDVQSAGAFVLPYQTVTVNSNLAEEYGYTDALAASEQVSALDVLVKMHELIYGDAFTTANCTDYLNVPSGWISKALEEQTTGWSFAVNGECAHSEVEIPPYGYMGLAINQTPVVDGDVCELMKNQDTVEYADQYLWFLQDNAKVTSLDVLAGSAIDLQLGGYPFMAKGTFGTAAILADHLSALSGVQLALMNEDGTLTAIPEAVTDEDGDVSLSFDDCGSYTVVATVPASSETKAFLSVLTVNVHQAVKASVYTDVQMAGAFTLPYQMVRVSSDLAESYGYVDSVPFWENVSGMDVLVKIHKMVYGDAFTAETSRDYLDVTESGWIKKVLEEDEGSWSIIFNGECAHTDVVSSYGGYEALSVNQTAVFAYDVVEFVAYQDLTEYADQCIWLTCDEERVDAVFAPVGEDITFSLASYAFAAYSHYGTEAIIDDYLTVLSGAQLAVMNQKGELTDIDDAVTDADGNVTISFNEEGAYTVVAYLPEESADKAFMAVVSVNAYIAKDAAKMTDLVPGAWYTESVSAMLSQGLMKGVSETRFEPNATLTRGMFVTMLYRYAGSPNSVEASFTDVKATAYYAAAVSWAYENEITNGVTATKFAPNDNITREQMATMILRFASVVGLDLPSGDGSALFDDDSTISPYAKDAVYSLAKAGVIKGMGHNKFAPKETATRAQAAEIIYRLQNLE